MPKSDSTKSADSELVSWHSRHVPASFPYRDALHLLRKNGKHFAPKQLLDQLAALRRDLAAGPESDEHSARLRSFLDIALDKMDGTYNYVTYIALPMLELTRFEAVPLARSEVRRACDRALVCLVADAIRFEWRSGAGEPTYLPLRIPHETRIRDRCVLGLKAIRPCLRRLEVAEPGSAGVAEWAGGVIESTGRSEGGLTEDQLDRSMLPVYVIHDEHLFLRVLQLSEVVLFWIAHILKLARQAIEEADYRARDLIADAADMMAQMSRLFLLLSSMDRESFRDFRRYTEGASAIQSRHYKLVESICRQPEPERLNSVAYRSVPELRSVLLEGQVSLGETFLAVIASGRMPESRIAELHRELADFALAVRRWRHAHYAIALRMLGPEPGTGYTEGTPYLKAVRDLPVFDFQQEGSARCP